MSVKSKIPYLNKFTTIGGIATIELSIRGIGSANIVDVVDFFAEGLIVTIAVGATTGSIGDTVSTVAIWTLYGYVIYTFLPNLFPEFLSNLSTDRIFVGLIAIGAVVMALPIETTFGNLRNLAISAGRGNDFNNFVPVIIGLFLLWSGIIWLYLRFGRKTPMLQEGSETRELVSRFGDSVAEKLTDPPSDKNSIDWVEMKMIRSGPSTVFGLIVFALGILIASLSQLYPIPELLFIGLAVINPIIKRTDRIRPTSIDIDFEQDIGTAIFTSLRTEKGIGLVTIIAVGVANSALVFFAGLFVWSRAIEDFSEVATAQIASGIISRPVQVSYYFVDIGAAVSLMIAGLLMLWVKVRLARRSVALVSAFTDNHTNEDEATEPTVSRPPGSVTVPVVLAAFAIPFVFSFESGGPLVTAYALSWPLGLIIVGIWFLYGIKKDPQPPLSDHWSHPISVIMEGALFGLFMIFSSNTELLLSLSLFSILLYLYFDMEIQDYMEKAGQPWEQFSDSTVALNAIPLFIAAISLDKFATVIVLLALLCIVTGILTALQKQ